MAGMYLKQPGSTYCVCPKCSKKNSKHKRQKQWDEIEMDTQCNPFWGYLIRKLTVSVQTSCPKKRYRWYILIFRSYKHIKKFWKISYL